MKAAPVVVIAVTIAALYGVFHHSSTASIPRPSDSAASLPLVVTASAMARQYDANKISAEAEYTGKSVLLGGTANDVNQDILGNYYVSFSPDASYDGLVSFQCFVPDAAAVGTVLKGAHVTVQGTVDDMSLGIIPLKDCHVIGAGS